MTDSTEPDDIGNPTLDELLELIQSAKSPLIDFQKQRIRDLFTAQQEQFIGELEQKLLDKSIALKNEDTAVLWDDVIALLTEGRKNHE